jgi:hypothetical protein
MRRTNRIDKEQGEVTISGSSSLSSLLSMERSEEVSFGCRSHRDITKHALKRHSNSSFRKLFLIIKSQQRVVLAPPNNQILHIHLHCLIAIFTPLYYYIYNDFFTEIYWIE